MSSEETSMTIEREKRYPEAEPTLYDVIEIMQSGFGRMEEKFEEIDVRFDQIDRRFEKMDKRFDDMDVRFDALTVDVRDCQQKLGRIEIQFEDLADTVLNHEERIVKLEMRD